MLTELRVRDLAVIADVTLPLASGFNVLTGETGAGKSMLVDALSLLLGERASVDLVRPGAARAIVEAAFDVQGLGPVGAAADDVGVDVEDDRLVVRREINATGRNRAWANGSPASVSALSSLGRLLVDLHGQHESQSLLRAGIQRDILDAFGKAEGERERVCAAYRRAVQLREDEAALVARRDDVRRRADYLRHVVKEITDAVPKSGETDALAIEAARLGNAEELTQLAERLLEVLESDEDRSALAALATVARTLGQLERLDESVGSWRELLDTAQANLDELAISVREYATDVQADPGRLAEVERRRDTLYRLMQKYGEDVAAVLRTRDEAVKELDVLDTADLDLERLEAEAATAEGELTAAAAELTTKRLKAAGKLANAVEELLPGLGMPDGKFSVAMRTLDGVTEAGADEVAFMVQLNPGLDARPLAKVASGGELSRIMLALKVVLSRHDAIPTLVFDEVDVGIGGAVAAQVGDALAEVARTRQVLVITHLPQIAARATCHLTVSKTARGGVATSDVRVVEGEERILEIARMLGGSDDPVAKQHAEELLKRGGPEVARAP